MDLLALFLGFHMDLLALCDGEISILRGDTTLHCIVSHWGCSLLEAATMAASATTSKMLRTSFFFAPAFLLLSTLAFVVYLAPTLVSGLLIGCSFWVLIFVSCGYILPFKFTPIQGF